MRFELEQRFTAGLTAVAEAFVDPALLARLAALPGLGGPDLLEQTDTGDTVAQQVRYAFTGRLSPAVTAVIDPARLTWVESSVLDRRTHRSTFTIRPEHYADRLRCSGTISLEVVGDGTRRLVGGDVQVRFPLVGSKVERAIVSGLREHAAAEVDLVQAWLDERR